jgi:glutamate-1-semialdehyde 2,1-aminomutase
MSSPYHAGPISDALWQRAQKRLVGGVNSPVRAFRGVGGEPFFVNKAQGSKIWDVDGREYIDFVGTWGPAILGHASQVVIDAVTETAKHGTSFGIPNPLEVEMAETICRLVPSVEKVRMTNSGTEAVMSAIRLARGVTGRDRIVKFEGCYHGHVDSLLVKAGSGALTLGYPDSAGIPDSLAALTSTIPFNDPESLKAVFREKGSEIACVILEPVPANAGLYLPEPGFLETIQSLCREHGALLIFGEVMTGFRLAPGGAQEVFGITPDLTTMGKVIGGGLPVGAFGGGADLMDHLSPLGPVYQAGTLSGNPLALAAGLAQLKEMERINGWALLEQLGAQMENSMRAITKGKPLTFKRIGSMFCLYFTNGPVLNLADAKKSDTAAFARYFHASLNEGIYFAPSQFEAGFLSTAHDTQELDHTAERINKILKMI